MTVLLIIIYVTFISLGLPDSVFGVSWPLIHTEMGLNVAIGSLFTTVVGACGGISSLFSGKLVRKFSEGKVTAFSVLLTAIGLIGYSFSTNPVMLVFFSLFLGFGAGAVDSVLNNFVSLHYKAIHMNWLHCFWGVGVTLSPMIMSFYLGEGRWRDGYRTISIIQIVITAALFASLPLWKKATDSDSAKQRNEALSERPKSGVKDILKIKGVISAIASIGLYCAMEFTVGTWGASYLVESRGLSAATAAKWISTFYFGIMAGRFISGLLSVKLNDKKIIRLGICVTMLGIITMMLPWSWLGFAPFIFIGLGFAPFFPCTLHATAGRFGFEYSQDITGFEMGGGYALGWTIQITFGAIASKTTFAFMPYMFIVINLLILIVTERINKITAEKRQKKAV